MKLFRSLSFKIISSILLIFLFLLFLMFYNTFYTKKYVRAQIIDSEKQVAALYMEKIDSILTNMDHLLLSMTTEWVDNGTLSAPQSRMALSYGKMIQQMNKQMAANNIIRFFYIYSPEKGDFLYDSNAGFYISAPDRISDTIEQDSFLQKPGRFTRISTWKPIEIDRQSYIYQQTSFQGYYMGILLDINILFDSSDFDKYTSSHSTPVFSTLTGVPLNEEAYLKENQITLSWDFSDYYISGENNSAIITGVRSLSGDFGLMVLIPNQPEIFSSAYIRDFLLLTVCAVLIYITVILILIRRFTLKPVKNLSLAMAQVTVGNLEVKIPEKSSSDEFTLVNRTFNQMTEQIKTLKIEAYEKKLELKNAEIEQLKMQINPHLFLNSLNLIYRLETDHSPYVSEATLALIQCFRYFVRQKAPFVTLKQELEYAASYRRIQELTWPERITFEREVPFFLENLFVPTMTVLEFVENAIKYALPYTTLLEIHLRAQLADMADKSFLVIDLWDNGPGYDEDILSLLRSRQTIVDKQDKKHIGIMNYSRRIQHLYNGEAHIDFYNEPEGGAHVCIHLPVIENSNWTVS